MWIMRIFQYSNLIFLRFFFDLFIQKFQIARPSSQPTLERRMSGANNDDYLSSRNEHQLQETISLGKVDFYNSKITLQKSEDQTVF